MDVKNPICCWDITMGIETTNLQVEDVKELFNKKFKKWCFQLEEGSETGFLHYQCRVSTWKKSREKPKIKGVHPNAITPTHHTKDNFYVMKEETRREGPWSNLDDYNKLTKQLKNFETSKWMRIIMRKAKRFCLRSIDIIYDEIGNNGKSLFTEHMEYNNLAEEIPPFRNMEDIFQWVYGRPKKSAYMVDMPRGMKKDKMAEFYSGIEVIKNGVSYDKRHFPKKERFDRPRIFVFTNTLPELELLSLDRWKIWIIRDGTLKDYTKSMADGNFDSFEWVSCSETSSEED